MTAADPRPERPGRAAPAHIGRAFGGRWRRARRSLRARLTGLFLLLALAMTLTFIGGMQAALRSGWESYARPLIGDYIDALAAEIGTPPDIEKARAITERLPLRIRIDGPRVQWSSHPAERSGGIDEHASAWRAGHDSDHANPWRPSRTLADGHRIRFALASPARDIDAPQERQRLIGWATLALMLLLVAIAHARVRHLLRPLEEIRAGAIRYEHGDFSAPIPARRDDELGALARQINGMADGLHHLLDAKRALLLAISHELRSPLTRARLNAELVDGGIARDALLRDLAQMRDLITELLESERLASGHAALHTEAVDLDALLRELIASEFAGRPIAVAFGAPEPLELDPSRIRLLLRNLIDNALRHNPAGAAPPRVTTRLQGNELVLGVRDFGPGVAPEHLAQLTEPFYRADPARQRTTGGVGLGLHLCALVARAHGGALAIRNAQPGLEVEVRLPRR